MGKVDICVNGNSYTVLRELFEKFNLLSEIRGELLEKEGVFELEIDGMKVSKCSDTLFPNL